MLHGDVHHSGGSRPPAGLERVSPELLQNRRRPSRRTLCRYDDYLPLSIYRRTGAWKAAEHLEVSRGISLPTGAIGV